jgi:CYTH domain-containing protein
MEIEYKFWAGDFTKQQFHSLLENAIGKRYEPKYVCSCDDYYTNSDTDSFLRYRKGGTHTELTLKQKREGNVVRKEINLDMTANDVQTMIHLLSNFFRYLDMKKHFLSSRKLGFGILKTAMSPTTSYLMVEQSLN